ncbi:hypothetical protein B0A50_03044 [Salinomyces thailandicus]|uniref:Zn(2)-C6 fungal-type domain-containing protein n=1 Tax=Salinomyces thailandicus TaxID=706561 RepID=A0A4U0U2S1_9PEZI|nr:hypothetical protein B0A50_03044 [Salinomyces thailandica]
MAMTADKVKILPLRAPARAAEGDDSGNGDGRGGKGVVRAKPAKISRASNPKVRTGCSTCKIRRVKCDEVKPECDRCTSTGRKCDGYNIPPRKKRPRSFTAVPAGAWLDAPERCLEVVSGTSPELRALEFFHARTAPALSSYFDADFWTRLVFQMSSAEPSIRHAMVTVGTLHQQRQAATMTPQAERRAAAHDRLATSVSGSTLTDGRFTLMQYNKAITHLTKRLQDSPAAKEIALLACILFVCVEFLRGEAELALNHFKSGMNIAIQTLTQAGAPMAQATMQRIRVNMLPFFNRLELLSTIFGNDAMWEYPIDVQYVVPERFAHVKEARDSMIHLMNLSLRFIRFVKYRKYDGLNSSRDSARQQVLKDQIRKWEQVLNTLLHDDVSLTPKDLDAARVLRIHQCIMHIWLSASIYPEQTATDALMNDFEATVSLCEAVQATAGTREQRQEYPTTFLFDMEIVSPLYFVASKCRHPLIRRRAIQLLQQMDRREGLWDSNVAAAIAERIVAIEETHLTGVLGNQLPEEQDRIHFAHIQSVPGVDSIKHAVTFYAKPHGVNQHWKIWQESIGTDPLSNINRSKSIDTHLIATGRGKTELSMQKAYQATPLPVPRGWGSGSFDALPRVTQQPGNGSPAGVTYKTNAELQHAEEKAKGMMLSRLGMIESDP